MIHHLQTPGVGPRMICLSMWFMASMALANGAAEMLEYADRILNSGDISYTYGGSQIGNGRDCRACTACLQEVTPLPKKRAIQCPICTECSIDCSHFVHWVHKGAGLPYPYLTTKGMLNLSTAQLGQIYKLRDLKKRTGLIAPGDMLVYEGHVVLVEAVTGEGRGHIVHATGGRDIREPGQGIQRETNVRFDSFRGPLLRILRHKDLRKNPFKTRLK